MACLSLAMLLLAACNKENNDLLIKGEIFPISFRGYNGSNEALILKLDTFTSKVQLTANSSFDNGENYTFLGNQNTVKVTISEKSSGKLVFEKEFKKEDRQAKFSLFYLDGKVGDYPEKPAVEEEKIKLIYLFQPKITGYSEPVDISIGRYFVTPQVYEEFARIKNLQPYVFSEAAVIPTFSTARQDYNGVQTSVSFHVRIYKAGTNIPYTDGTAYTWNVLNSSGPKPSASVAASKLYIFTEQPLGNIMRFLTNLDQ